MAKVAWHTISPEFIESSLRITVNLCFHHSPEEVLISRPLPSQAGSLHCIVHTAFVLDVSAVAPSCAFSGVCLSSSSIVCFFLFFFLHGLYRLCVQTQMKTMSRIRNTNPATTHAMTIFLRSPTWKSISRYSHLDPIYPFSHLHDGVFCSSMKRQTPWMQKCLYSFGQAEKCPLHFCSSFESVQLLLFAWCSQDTVLFAGAFVAFHSAWECLHRTTAEIIAKMNLRVLSICNYACTSTRKRRPPCCFRFRCHVDYYIKRLL